MVEIGGGSDECDAESMVDPIGSDSSCAVE